MCNDSFIDNKGIGRGYWYLISIGIKYTHEINGTDEDCKFDLILYLVFSYAISVARQGKIVLGATMAVLAAVCMNFKSVFFYKFCGGLGLCYL